MKVWITGRRLLAMILAATVCLFLCAPFAVDAQSGLIPGTGLPDGGTVVLAAVYSSGEETVYYAMGTILDRKLEAVPIHSETPASELPVWTIQVSGNGVSLFNGREYLTYDSETYFGSSDQPFIWLATEGADGTLRLCASAEGPAIGYNHNGGDGRFGVYSLSEEGNSQYQFDIMVFALGTGDVPQETTPPEETTLPAEVPEETTQPAAPPEQPDPLPSGTGVLWLKGQNIALSGKTDSNGYLTGTAVLETGGILTGYGPEDIWCLETGEGNGGMLLLHEGKKLSLPESGDAPVWDGLYSSWELLQEDSAWLIRSVSRSDCYLGWNPMLRTWHVSPLPETGRENFLFSFTPAQGNVELPRASQVAVSPNGGELYPAGGAAITLTTDTPGGEIYYATSPDGEHYSEFSLYTQPIVPEAGFGSLWVKAYVVAPGYENSPETVCGFTERTSYYGFYFGQLHAHTAVSDGIGTAEEAFVHAAQVENLDFLAVTDHSNSFDNDALGALSADGSPISGEWAAGKAAAAAVTNREFVGLYGFEMTWNNGLGHISTFGTPGWASRNQAAYQTLGTALETYYVALAAVPGSVSQFNHPGAVHGDFEGFSHYSPEADRAITLIEVFNSDVGDAYEAYIRALDLGWHLAPTCNQDNHSGQWGSLDPGRTVVMANTLTEANLLDGMRNYRVYATKDSDLKIFYTLDGNLMGSRLFDYGEEVTIQVSLSDATDGGCATVEVVGSGGAVAASQSINGSGTLSLPSTSRYYFLRITQPDGDVAVTAPVWLEKQAALELTGIESDSAITTAGEARRFTIEITNRLPAALSGAAVTVTDGSGQVLASGNIDTLPGESSSFWSFTHTFPQDGVHTLTVTVTAGNRTISRELTVTVMPRSIISDVIVDGTHGAAVEAKNLIALAEDGGFKAHVETRIITAEQLEHCSLLLIPAPGTAFEPKFTELVASFVAKGGNVLLCGASDASNPGTAARMNSLLAAIGSTMTLSDDTVYDPASNGGMPDVIFPETVNTESRWTKGFREGQVYSHRSGCSVNPGSGSWLVKGFGTTFCVDGDFNGLECSGETYREISLDDSDNPKEILYRLVKSAGDICLLAVEETAGGAVFLAGGGFPFDGSMQYELDNVWDLPYANRTIFGNMLGISAKEPQVTSIAQVRAAENGGIFLIEGYVTAGTENPHNRLPETIYVQDGTGGIAAVPYTDSGLALGTKVRITGTVTRVHGDIQLEILQLTVMEASKQPVVPAAMENEKAMDYGLSGGLLVQVEGTVTDVTIASDGQCVTGFTLVDSQGVEARVLIEDTIRSGTTGINALANTVRIGNRVSAVGLVYHSEGTVLRVRDCDEVVLLWASEEITNGNPPTGDSFPLDGLLLCMALCLLGAVALYRRKRA